MPCLDAQGLEKNMTEKVMTMKIGKYLCGQYQWANVFEDFMPRVNAHPGETSGEEGFNNHVDRMISQWTPVTLFPRPSMSFSSRLGTKHLWMPGQKLGMGLALLLALSKAACPTCQQLPVPASHRVRTQLPGDRLTALTLSSHGRSSILTALE